MPWKGSNLEYFEYTPQQMRDIAACYGSLYEDGLEFTQRSGLFSLVNNPYSVVEFKADFDTALDNLGRGHWDGRIDGNAFQNYGYFGTLQRVVIAQICGYEDWELEEFGFYQVPQLLGRAYSWMAKQANGLPYGNSLCLKT